MEGQTIDYLQKKKIARFKAHPNYKKAIHWSGLISITAGSQVIIQITSFLCGILIIRNFAIGEYAFYTLANTMLGAMNILADGGIVSGAMAEGGKVWLDKNKLGAVITTGMNLRKKFAIGSVIISGSILIYLLVRNNAPWYYSFLVLMSLIPTFYANLSDGILEIAPKLHQDIKPLQKNQLFASFGRLALTLPAVLISPFTPLAIIAAGIPRMVANFQLKKIANKFITNQPENVAVKRNILKMVKRILPGEVYNIFSVQITVWILSITGSVKAIANVGALFRIGAVLSLINILFNTLIVPRYSRLPESKKTLLENMIKIQLLLLLVSIITILTGYLFSHQLIWLLGNNYKGLEKELLLTVVIFCLNITANVIYTLCRGRGWVINPAVSIGINLLSIFIGVLVFNVKSLLGVLVLNIEVSFVLVLMHAIYSYWTIYKLRPINLR